MIGASASRFQWYERSLALTKSDPCARRTPGDLTKYDPYDGHGASAKARLGADYIPDPGMTSFGSSIGIEFRKACAELRVAFRKERSFGVGFSKANLVTGVEFSKLHEVFLLEGRI
jgi:hypothetical protein